MEKFKQLIANNKKTVIALFGLLVISVSLFAINYQAVGSYARYEIYDDAVLKSKLDGQVAGIVFGGGIENGKPSPLIKDRLDKAVNLQKNGVINKILVSGDNRFKHYDEPKAMQDYLINEKKIDKAIIQMDAAGRSTYETCERAKKVFSLDKAVLISEHTHLPRAIYLCRQFGIEAFGSKSDGQSASGRQVGQRFRELLARTKASLNVYVIGEKTVLGEKIDF